MLLIILIIILIFVYINKNLHENFKINSEKPYVWVYWEGTMPPFIELCIQIMNNKLSNDFNFILLDQNNIYNYLPEIKSEFKQILNNFKISHKVDYYRILLLEKYGGIYLDADIIVLKNMTEFIKKLDDYDYVGFGCTGITCFDGYGTPSNWAMISRKNGIFITKVRYYQENILNKILNGELKYSKNGNELDYHFIGKLPMWNVIADLIKNNNYKYYHYDNSYTGIRDINGDWVHNDKLISNKPIEYKNPENICFIVFYNSETINNIEEYFKNKTKEQLINDKTNLSIFLQRGLDKN